MASHSQHEQQNEKSADEHKDGLEVIPTTAEDEADTVPTASALILTASSGTSDEK